MSRWGLPALLLLALALWPAVGQAAGAGAVTRAPSDVDANRAVTVIALDEAYGLGAESHAQFAERLHAVTRDDLMRVAQAYLDPQRSVTALVSPDA